MAYQDLNTLKNWFKRGLKPLSQQFWDWMDSFWHKSQMIPAAMIEGLQALLDAKLDKKDAIPPEQVGEYSPTKNYVYDAALAEYVSFSNAQSSDPQFQVEGFYRLTEDAPAGENPETHPEHWAYQGYTLGEITIDDVVGLYEELLKLSYSDGINLRDPSSESIDGIGTKVSQALVQLKTAILVIQDYLRNIGSAVAAFEADPVPQQVSETETRLTFTKAFESNNPDAIEVDDVFDTVSIKRAGKWQFISTLNASNSSFFSAHDLWLTTRDQSDDEIITQRPINIPASGYSGSSSYIFDVQEADLPLTLEFFHQGDSALQIESLTTNIVSLESVGGGGIVDDALSEISENPVQNKVVTAALANAGDKTFTAPYSFSGFDSFPTNFGRKVRIDSVSKAADITELRAGKNGATPTDITPQLPLTIEASDSMVFEATYNRESASNFTLIGIKL